MVGGLHGKPGAVVAKRVAVDHRHACALVPVLCQVMVGLTAKVWLLKRSHVIAMLAL